MHYINIRYQCSFIARYHQLITQQKVHIIREKECAILLVIVKTENIEYL